MRYVVVPYVLGTDHPNWPGQKVYVLKDTKTNSYLSMTLYTNQEKAQCVADEKNARETS